MKKLFLLSALVLAIVSCGGGSADSPSQGLTERYASLLTPPESYVCYRTSTGIRVDGRLDESDWEKAPMSKNFVDISTDVTPAKQTNVKMLWDNDYLYIAAIIEEDHIVANLKQRDTIIWKENDFEVFIDPDGDGQSYFEIELNARGTIMDLMMNRPYRNGGDFYMPWNCPGLIVKTSKTQEAWYAEIAVPLSSVMMGFTKPSSLSSWRINFSRVEWIPGQENEENWVWSPTGMINMHMPERWGWLFFDVAPIGSIDCEDRPVAADIAHDILWAMFYAQMDAKSEIGVYLTDVKDFGLSAKEKDAVGDISVEATSDYFKLEVCSADGKRYTVDSYSNYSCAASPLP